MLERLKNSLESKLHERASRRQFVGFVLESGIRAAAFGEVVSFMTRMTEGQQIVLRLGPPIPEPVVRLSSEDYSFVSSIKPTTIDHRAGNSYGGVEAASKMGISVVDIDGNKWPPTKDEDGEVYACHGRIIGVKGQIIGDVDRPDKNTIVIRRGTPPKVSDILKKCQQQGEGEMIELKMGEYNVDDVRYLWETAQKYDVSADFHSRDLGNFQAAIDATGDPSKVAYVPRTPADWQTAKDEKIAYLHTNSISALWQIPRMPSGVIFSVGDVTNVHAVKELYALGVNKFMNDLQVIGALFPYHNN